MTIGSSLFLVVAGLVVTAALGRQPGQADIRVAGVALALVGVAALCAAIARRERAAAPPRRRAGQGRPAGANRPVRRMSALPARVRRRAAARDAWVLPRRSAPPSPAPEPVLPLSSLGKVSSLVDHTQVPGQHGKLPPSPRGRWRYPC